MRKTLMFNKSIIFNPVVVAMYGCLMINPIAVQAQDFAKIYPGLAEWTPSYEFFDRDQMLHDRFQNDPDETINDAVVKYYQIPEDMRSKLSLGREQLSDDYYIKSIFIKNANKNKEKYRKEAALMKAIQEKSCQQASQYFESRCFVDRPAPRDVIVNIKDSMVVPLPGLIAINPKIAPLITPKIALGNPNIVNRIHAGKLELFAVRSSLTGLLLNELNYSLMNSTYESHRCYAGSHAIDDVNGDGVDDIIFLAVKVVDERYSYGRAAPRDFAYVRTYAVAVDISSGVAKPLFQQELFAYEMDYTIANNYDEEELAARQSRLYTDELNEYGQGIVRQPRLYWGDFNGDGKHDYLVRRRQTDIGFYSGMQGDQWKTEQEKEVETILLFIGDDSGYQQVEHTGEDFINFIKDTAEWEQGFIDPHNRIETTL